MTRAIPIQVEPHDQATRCRGNAEGLHTLVQAAGALAAFRSFGPGLTTANILDSESKISPLSSPLGSSPESWKAAELLKFGLPSWSAGPTPNARVPGSGRCSWHTMIHTGGSFMPDVSELELTTRSSAGYGGDCNRSPLPRCRCRWRHPRSNRFGSPLVLSRVHWVRPELVVEVKYLTWTDENLLRQVVYEGLREDKDPTDVRRPTPNQSAR